MRPSLRLRARRLQLTFDMLNAKSVPDGYGHNYDAMGLDGWTTADTRRVRAGLAR